MEFLNFSQNSLKTIIVTPIVERLLQKALILQDAHFSWKVLLNKHLKFSSKFSFE